MTYDEYASKACKRLMDHQEKFLLQFDINSYGQWFYTQSTEILELHDDDKALYFKYIPVGTFSQKTKTWMWAWANDNSVEPRKLRTAELKEFGTENNWKYLFQAYSKGDEFTGWELTSIAFEKLGGIGTYRVISEHLEIYFLITDVVTKEESKRLENELIECPVHGQLRKAFICQHLNNHTITGFEEAFMTHWGMELEDDDDLQAWCSVCEEERLRTDGWNEESMKFAQIKLVCEKCYFDIKHFNLSNG